MKLHELGAPRQTEQLAKVLESYSGQSVNLKAIGANRARGMLQQIQGLLAEHRNKPAFHRSEQHPAYLKLVMLEQALSVSIAEQLPAAGAQTGVQTGAQPGATAMRPQSQSQIAATAQSRKKEIQDQIKAKQDEIRSLQQQMNNPGLGMMEQRRLLNRRLTESELQQAQVVLAAQDMIDRVQGMLEDISEMQFKDLPALADSIKNDIGTNEATQFQSDATAAFTQLLAAVQAGKQSLEAAQGVITGQAPQIPGADAAAMPGAEPGADVAGLDAAAGVDDLDAAAVDADAEIDDLDAGPDLGRERR
jgi:hypothetical protein